jgi:quercetin dioxygenase-like cupin family protein
MFRYRVAKPWWPRWRSPQARAGRHTHPGDEISYISEGEVDLLIDGQPPRTLKAGETFVVCPLV